MPDREKIRLMTRIAMLENSSGKKIRKAETTSRIDLITNPVWRWGFGITLIFFAAAAVIAVLNMNMILDAVAKDQTKNLIMIVLIAWLSLLAVTIVISFVLSVSKTRRISSEREQYRQMLLQLKRMNAMEKRQQRPDPRSFSEDDLWDEPPERSGRRRGGRPDEDDLDYGNMQVLEFEDDDYCYYVEAVPKRAGSRPRAHRMRQD